MFKKSLSAFILLVSASLWLGVAKATTIYISEPTTGTQGQLLSDATSSKIEYKVFVSDVPNASCSGSRFYDIGTNHVEEPGHPGIVRATFDTSDLTPGTWYFRVSAKIDNPAWAESDCTIKELAKVVPGDPAPDPDPAPTELKVTDTFDFEVIIE